MLGHKKHPDKAIHFQVLPSFTVLTYQEEWSFCSPVSGTSCTIFLSSQHNQRMSSLLVPFCSVKHVQLQWKCQTLYPVLGSRSTDPKKQGKSVPTLSVQQYFRDITTKFFVASSLLSLPTQTYTSTTASTVPVSSCHLINFP